MTMKIHATVLLAAISLAGCSTYRVTSNIPGTIAVVPPVPVLLVEGELQAERAYHELGPIEVTVRKGNPFVDAPGRRQADSALTQKARHMGAEAVIRIQYKDGFDIVSWGHIEASGVGIRFDD